MPETIRDLDLMGAILAGLRRECGEDVFSVRLECLRLAMQTLSRSHPSYPPDSGLQTHFSGSDIAVIAVANRYWQFVKGSSTEPLATDAA